MPVDVLILSATAVLAGVALLAAVVSARNVREVRRRLEALETVPAPTSADSASSDTGVLVPLGDSAGEEHTDLVVHTSPALQQDVQVVEGRVIVAPTRAQVAAAVMGQPRVRIAIWANGIVHALRPESRDRIVGMMRRDYRERRRHRGRVARRAARAAHHPSDGAEEWISS